jgi:hypothetical protein
MVEIKSKIVIGNERLWKNAPLAGIGPSRTNFLFCGDHGYIKREQLLYKTELIDVCYKCLIFNVILGDVQRVGTSGERGFSIAREREGGS